MKDRSARKNSRIKFSWKVVFGAMITQVYGTPEPFFFGDVHYETTSFIKKMSGPAGWDRNKKPMKLPAVKYHGANSPRDDRRKSLQQILHEGSCSTQHPGFPGHGERGEERSSLSICNWILSWKVILTFQANVCLMFHHGFWAVKDAPNLTPWVFHEKHFPISSWTRGDAELHLEAFKLGVHGNSSAIDLMMHFYQMFLDGKEGGAKVGGKGDKLHKAGRWIRSQIGGNGHLGKKMSWPIARWEVLLDEGCYEKKSPLPWHVAQPFNRGKIRKKTQQPQASWSYHQFPATSSTEDFGGDGGFPSLKKSRHPFHGFMAQ